jgi:hypothetical protein
MDMLVDVFFMFLLPALAAFLAVGSAGKKLAWYAGTAALSIAADLFTGAISIAQAQANGTSPNFGPSQTLREWACMFIVNVIMIALAATSGKKCPACLSRIHPKAVRCPKCQTEIPAATGTVS